MVVSEIKNRIHLNLPLSVVHKLFLFLKKTGSILIVLFLVLQATNLKADSKSSTEPAIKEFLVPKKSEPSATLNTTPLPFQRFKQDNTNYYLHGALIAAPVISYFQITQEESSIDSLRNENDSLLSRANSTTNTAEYNSLQTKYENNIDQINSHKQNIQYLQYISLITLGIEAWLAYEDFLEDRLKISVDYNAGDKSAGVSSTVKF